MRRWGWRMAALVASAAVGWSCGSDGDAGAPGASASLDTKLAALTAAEGLKGSPTLKDPPLTAAQRDIRDKRRDLGRSLFFDHALSGVEQTSCATCHHAAFQFGDARNIARGVFCDLVSENQIVCHDAPAPGTGGNVLGPDRTSPLNSRNTPSVINAGLFPRLMWNGRFHFIDESSTDVNTCDPRLGFELPPPEGVMLTRSLPTAQGHIPVTEAVEMTGDFPHPGHLLEDAEERNPEVRSGIATRISAIAAYHALFEAAYPVDRPDLKLFDGDPEVEPADNVPYLAIGDALGHFQEALVFTDAPWDHYLRGEHDAISAAAKRGALVFYTDHRCSSCHSGDLFSDFQNHNVGVPQVGPGTGRSDPTDVRYQFLKTWDFGLEEISFRRLDRFKFRTPPLRGVALTAPYMHNGAYATLEATIRHHADPRAAYERYDINQIELDMQAADGLKPLEPLFEDTRNPVELGNGPKQKRIDLTDADVGDLIEFLKALTDPRMLDTASMAPETVPSGLPLDVPGPARFATYQ